jgi:hypothetical protein
MKAQKKRQKFEEIEHSLKQYYPTLHLTDENGQWFIRGIFPVRANGGIVDHYLIEIFIPHNYPKNIPEVKELGGRIKRHPDWHVSADGTLCLFIPLERWKHMPDTATVITFLDGPLNDHLFSQTYFELHGHWPFGERGHGIEGVKEYLSEELGTDDVLTMRRLLEYLSTKRPKGHWVCFCGSGKKMRHCHFDTILDLREKIRPSEARYTLRLFGA